MAVLEALTKTSGADSVRKAGKSDAVDGIVPSYVVVARNADTVTATMLAATEHDLAVVPRGRGTKLDWGNPPTSLDIVIDVSQMDSVLEHSDGDLIVRVQPGVRLAVLQRALAVSGQRLAIDEVVPDSTIGGVIATGLSGPSRLLYGAVRDLLIGITVVRADGVLARSGGKVVKNVAGYDLGKLYTGSYGTLGIITEATFRLHPLPETVAYVTAVYSDERAAAAPAAAVLRSQLAASAIEFDRPVADGALTVCVLLEGSVHGVSARAERLMRLLGGSAATLVGRPAWWGSLPGTATIRTTTQVAGFSRLLSAAARATGEHGIPLAMRGSVGSGVLYVGFGPDADPIVAARLLADLRAACAAEGGSAVLLRAPAEIKAAVDSWGPVPSMSLMHRVKDKFDPGRRLAPGRFVGGI